MSTTAFAKKKSLQDRLRDGVVLCGEGYVFELERRGYVKSGPYVPEVVIDFPVAVQELHREFVRAGSDVVLALTYYAHRDKMKVVNREREVEALNRQAVKLAKEVADALKKSGRWNPASGSPPPAATWNAPAKPSG